MKITNVMNLPAPIVSAIKSYEMAYHNGNADFSVTDLIAPPQQYALRRIFDDRLTEDASDRIWTLLGTSIHEILSRSIRGSQEGVEQRMYATILGKVVSGKYDHLAYDGATLTDYKVTSVWSVMGNLKPEWEKQLNYYRYLCVLSQVEIQQIQITAILRDWRLSEKRRNPDYPSHNVVTIPVPVWADYDVAFQIAMDVQSHMDALEGNYRPCTDEERWASPVVYAVMKKGRKSAVKLFNTEAEAKAHIHGYDDNFSVVTRPGEYRRCENYCPVKDFCEQYKGGNE